MARKAEHSPAADPSPEERTFADEVGFYWEEAGGTRMAGRVLGALLLADPPEMSSSHLAMFLGVSGGSVSTATRELILPGLITACGSPDNARTTSAPTWVRPSSRSSSALASR